MGLISFETLLRALQVLAFQRMQLPESCDQGPLSAAADLDARRASAEVALLRSVELLARLATGLERTRTRLLRGLTPSRARLARLADLLRLYRATFESRVQDLAWFDATLVTAGALLEDSSARPASDWSLAAGERRRQLARGLSLVRRGRSLHSIAEASLRDLQRLEERRCKGA